LLHSIAHTKQRIKRAVENYLSAAESGVSVLPLKPRLTPEHCTSEHDPSGVTLITVRSLQYS